MAQLVWNPIGNSIFESGLDRGVLYVGTNPGVPWNGLISVDMSFEGAERMVSYFDGIELFEIVRPSTFSAVLKAFSSPAEFGECLGEKSFMPGFIVTNQIRIPFGLSYRTLVGDGAYKIHILYNATVSTPQRPNQSVGKSPAPMVLQWELDAIAEESVLFDQCIPTAHLVVDSNQVDPDALAIVEAALYGAGTEDDPISEPMLLAPNVLWTTLLGSGV